MEVEEELNRLKNRVKSCVLEAVNDTARLAELVKLLEDLERDAISLGQLERNVGLYRTRLTTTLDGTEVPKLTVQSSGSKKQRGNAARQAFAQAHNLTQVKGVVYVNPAGSNVAIAMATEDKRGNKWWLGLPDAQFSCVVLLCKDGNSFVEFVLPAQSISTVWPRLSRDSAGQVKFNAKKEGLRYVLLVPGYGEFDITRFAGDYSPLGV